MTRPDPEDRSPKTPYWHRWQVVVQTIVAFFTLAALVAAVWSAAAASDSARIAKLDLGQTRKILGLQNRPRLFSALTELGVAQNRRLLKCRHLFVNKGGAPADWVYTGHMQLNTREPVAALWPLNLKAIPTSPAFPGDSGWSQRFEETLQYGSAARCSVYYLHLFTVYSGGWTNDTFYTETVFYVNTAWDQTDPTAADAIGQEQTYEGTVSAGLVVPRNFPPVDDNARDSAESWAAGRLIPETDSVGQTGGPIATVKRMLMDAGFDSSTADYTAALAEYSHREGPETEE